MNIENSVEKVKVRIKWGSESLLVELFSRLSNTEKKAISLGFFLKLPPHGGVVQITTPIKGLSTYIYLKIRTYITI